MGEREYCIFPNIKVIVTDKKSSINDTYGTVILVDKSYLDFFLFGLLHVLSLSQPKRILRLVCSRIEIPEKISVKSFNLKFNH